MRVGEVAALVSRCEQARRPRVSLPARQPARWSSWARWCCRRPQNFGFGRVYTVGTLGARSGWCAPLVAAHQRQKPVV